MRIVPPRHPPPLQGPTPVQQPGSVIIDGKTKPARCNRVSPGGEDEASQERAGYRKGDASPIARARTLLPAYLSYASGRLGAKMETPGQSVLALPGVKFRYQAVT